MAIPKYTDPGVQNNTQDAATDRVDDIRQTPVNPVKQKDQNNSSDNKKKGYREGNRDDSITENEPLSRENKDSSYGKRL